MFFKAVDSSGFEEVGILSLDDEVFEFQCCRRLVLGRSRRVGSGIMRNLRCRFGEQREIGLASGQAKKSSLRKIGTQLAGISKLSPLY